LSGYGEFQIRRVKILERPEVVMRSLFSTKSKAIGVSVFASSIVLTAMLASFAAASETATIGSDDALRKLEEGNKRYLDGKNTFFHIGADRRGETAKDGQHPFATVVSCSDSRLPVEILFDQGIGDVFVIRVAGNVCNVDEVGSAEYGADHLGTPVLVVLGHTKCGAVTAVAKGAELHGNIHALVHGIFPAVEQAKKDNPQAEGDALVAASIKANVWQSIEDLLTKSPLILKRVQDGKLKIVGAIYNIENGSVEWLGEHPQMIRWIDTKEVKSHSSN
jgi:carbonic anhydrase